MINTQLSQHSSKLNHYPLGRKFPSHAAAADTCSPKAAITCPACRAMLEWKVAAHRLEAAASRSGQKRAFFAADANHWQAVLDVA